MDGGEGPLLGRGHQLMVEHLLDRLSRLQAGEAVPRVMVLRAESGTGKSRIVREVYERLRRAQPLGDDGEGYWPALPVVAGGPGGHGEPMPVRKVIGPNPGTFDRGEGAAPSFAWLFLTCGRRESGDIIEVAFDLGTQMRRHARYLVWAWRQRTEDGEQVQAWLRHEWKTVVEKSATHGGVEGIAVLLNALGAVVPGVGVAVDAGVAAARHWWDDRITRRRLAAGGALDDDPLVAPAELYQQLSRVAHPRLPMVLAVEDLHLMGDGLAGLLTLLAQLNPNWPVLVIGTAWPEGDQEPVYGQWVEQATTPGPDGPALAEVVDLAGLDPDALGELLRRHAPHTDTDTSARVVAAWPNPYALQLMLTDPGVDASYIINGALQVTDEEIRYLPKTVVGLYEKRWEYLPTRVAEALMIAAGCQPAEAVDAPASWPFLRGVVAGAAARSGLLDSPDDVVEALGEAADPHEWARITDTTLDLEHFREWVQARIASNNQASDLRYRTLPQAAAAELEDWIGARTREHGYWLDPDDPETLTACRWLLALTPNQPPSEARSVAAYTIARAQAAVHQYQAALATLDQVGFPSGLDPRVPRTLEARHIQAVWQHQIGRRPRAIDLIEAVLEDRLRLLGPDDPATLVSRNDLALAYLAGGRIDEAIDMFTAVLEVRLPLLGPDDPATLVSRTNLASAYLAGGRIDEAIDMFTAVLEVRLRLLGPDDPATLVSLTNLADALRGVGLLDAAIQMFAHVLAVRLRDLGPDDPKTLLSQNNLADSYMEVGRLDEAIPLLERSLAARERIFGSDYPETLLARNNLAGAYRSDGRLDDAISLLEGALAGLSRVLGPDDQDSDLARTNLAECYLAGGRVDEAIDLFAARLRSRLRVLGADHPDTLTSRYNLAHSYESAGRLEEAIPLYEKTLAEAERVLGADHPDTLGSRSNLANALGLAGRIEEATSLYEATLADCERTLSTTHQLTRIVRNNLAYAYWSAGRLEEAIPLYEMTLADCEQALGPTHPMTRKVRASLEASRGQRPDSPGVDARNGLA